MVVVADGRREYELSNLSENDVFVGPLVEDREGKGRQGTKPKDYRLIVKGRDSCNDLKLTQGT